MSVVTMRAVELPSGDTMPVLGLGTWHLGEGRHPPEVEIDALRTGLDLGMALVDTAEMYGDGATETLVGRAMPHHATFGGTIAACEGSLRRLGTDRLDLYLLHWRGSVPLDETVGAFEELKRTGRIRHWGVSNFDVADLAALANVRGGQAVEADQVLYNLLHRGIEWNLLPLCRRSGIPVMAYSPIEQGRLADDPVLQGIGRRRRATATQVALAWVVSHPGVCAIPEAGTPQHVRQNAAALQVELEADDVVEIDAAFPPPARPVPLEVL